MKKISQVIALLLCSLMLSSHATAELSVSPRRIVLDQADRAATVTLLNRGAVSETYRIYWVYRRMTEDLNIEAAESADDAGVGDAAAFIRYAPRQVTLMPGESQTVRLLARRPADLPEGEYRTHLMFEREPELITAHTSGESELSLSIHMAHGVTIPVIVRHGTETPAAASMRTDLHGTRDYLQISLTREGPHSLYGQLRAVHVANGTETVLATVPNFAVYSEVDEANANLPLQWPVGHSRDHGEIHVELFSNETANEHIIARDVVPLR